MQISIFKLQISAFKRYLHFTADIYIQIQALYTYFMLMQAIVQNILFRGTGVDLACYLLPEASRGRYHGKSVPVPRENPLALLPA